MRSLHLRLVLEGDVAISEHGATVGGHRCARRLLGGQLRGAAAARLYRSLPVADAFELFDSGRVRFGDGRPEGAGAQPAFPVPFALHVPKGERPVVDGRLSEAVFNGLLSGTKDRPTQLRELFIDRALTVHDPATVYSMRTAVDVDGRPQEGLLFGIEALCRDQVFFARIDADDEVARHLDRLATALVDTRVHLGRSRSAEFGAVHIERSAPWQEPFSTQAQDQDRVAALCLSDLALVDPVHGHPTTELDPRLFGMDGWRWVPSASFVRTRRYSPFNGFRRRPDLERQVWGAGSVFVLERERPDAPRPDLGAGVGAWRHDGLGQIGFWPTLLSEPPSRWFAAFPSSPASKEEEGLLPDDVTGQWLAEQIAAREAVDLASSTADAWAQEMVAFGVGRAQWGEVRMLGRQLRQQTAAEAAEAVRQHTSEGTRGLSRAWGRRHGQQLASERLVELVRACTGDPGVTLEIAAARVVRLAALGRRR
jgi:CRISPR-associated protein Csx10